MTLRLAAHLPQIGVTVLSALALMLAGCVNYRSTLHNSSAWSAFQSRKLSQLPDASITVGRRQLAFDHSILITIPIGGGYVGTLIAEDPSIVRIDFSKETRRTYLTGLKPGRTRMYLVNGYVHGKTTHIPAAQQEHRIDGSYSSYLLSVLPAGE